MMAASHRRNSESSVHRPIFEVKTSLCRSSSESSDLPRSEFCLSKNTDDIPRKKSVLKRDFTRPSGGSKRVSFSSLADERRVLDADSVLLHIQHGMEFVKLRPGGRQYQRYYQYDRELGSLIWKPSSKKAGKAQLPIDLICEVRAGKKTTLFREYGSEYSQDCSFSLIIAPNYDTVDLVAKSAEEANIWITGIRLITRTGPYEENANEESIRDKWLKSQFQSADTNSAGWIGEKEIMQLLKKLNIHIPLKTVQLRLQETVNDVNMEDEISEEPNTTDGLSEETFVPFFKALVTRQEIYFLLIKYSSNGTYLTVDDLLIFLETEQGIACPSKTQALDVIDRCEPTDDGKSQEILGIDGFARYFQEPDCDILDPKHHRVIQDMRKPLSHYFINSSHNTFMLEDQIAEKVGVQAYVRAMQQGCRCLQVDCWDGPASEPIVCRNSSSAHKILFVDVMEAISKHAFDYSEYPMIISLRNHCSIEQQKKMVNIIRRVVGDKLYINPDREDARQLPSPFQLKRKIVIKSKRLNSSSDQSGDVSDDEESDDITNGNTTVTNGNGNVKDNNSNGGSRKESINYPQKIENNSLKKVIKLCKELSDLVSICKTIRCADLQSSIKKQKPIDMCTFGETTARNLSETNQEDVLSYNKRLLAKVIPSAHRLDSSNFNPQEFWNYGYQMIAMNFQTVGFPMDLNRGRFLQNGGCGYVLKPSIMREEISYYSPTTKTELPGISYATLYVKLISGYQLPKPKGSTAKGDAMDPFILVEVSGLPVDTRSFRSKTVPHNGFNPLFDETFVFRVMMPELAMLRFVVLDDDFIGDGFIGQYCAPIDCLQQGYRNVKLTYSDGSTIPSASLLVHVTITRSHEMASPKMQRFSISKSAKKNKENVNLKTIGVKVIDDTFKLAIQPLQESTTFRESFQRSLNTFKECCGFTAKASVKNCLRVIMRRYSHPGFESNENDKMSTSPTETSSSAISLVKISLNADGEHPSFHIEGSMPIHLQKSVGAFDALIEHSRNLLDKFDDVYERLTHARRSALEWHENISKICAKEGLKEKRIAKVFENFSWNIRILSGQIELFKSAKTSAKDVFKQVQESAAARPSDKRSRKLSDAKFVAMH